MAQQYCLQVVKDDENTTINNSSHYFELKKHRLLIGNAAYCDISVNSDSPEHAIIFQGFSGWFLKKTNDNFELFVNDKALDDSDAYYLKQGDVISLNTVKLQFTEFDKNKAQMENDVCDNNNVNLGVATTIESSNENRPKSDFFIQDSSKEVRPDDNSNMAELPDKYAKLKKDFELSSQYIASLESDLEELHKYYKSAFDKENNELISKLKKTEADYDLSQSYVATLESDFEELKNFYQQGTLNETEELKTELRAAKVKHDNLRIENMVERNKLTLEIWRKGSELLAEKDLTEKLRIQLENLSKTYEWTLYLKNYLQSKLDHLEKSYKEENHQKQSKIDEMHKSKMRAKFQEPCKEKYQLEKMEQDLKRQLEEEKSEKAKLNVEFAAREEKYKQEAIDLRKQNDRLQVLKHNLETLSLEQKSKKVRDLTAKLSSNEQQLSEKTSELVDLRKKYGVATSYVSKYFNLVSEKEETDSKIENLTETLGEREIKIEKQADENAKLRSEIEELRSSKTRILKNVQDLLDRNKILTNDVAALRKEKSDSLEDYTKKLASKDEQIDELKKQLTEQVVSRWELEQMGLKVKEIKRLKDKELDYVTKIGAYERQVRKLELTVLAKEKSLEALHWKEINLRADLNKQKRASDDLLSKETALHLETTDKLRQKQDEVIELYQVLHNLESEFEDTFKKFTENELNCAVCSDLLKEAVTLNCTHTFCSECISTWKRNKNECPICRSHISQEVKVPAINNFIEKVKNMSAKSRVSNKGTCSANNPVMNPLRSSDVCPTQ